MATPAQNKFGITIFGVDLLSRTLKRITGGAKEMARPFDRAGKLIDGVSKNTGLQKFSDGLTGAAVAAGSISKNIEGILPSLGELLAMGSVAGLADLSANWAGQARHISLVSQYTDISTDSLQRWANAADAAGISGAGMMDEMNVMQQKIQDALFKRDPNAFALFNELHTDIGTQERPARADDVIRQLAAQSKRDPVVFQKILAAHGLSSFAPLLTSLDRYMGAGDQHGVIFNSKQIAAAKEFKDSLNLAQVEVESLGKTIGNDLVPELKPMVDGMTQWLNVNRQLISDTAKGDMKVLGESIHTIGIDVYNVGKTLGAWSNEAEEFTRILETTGVAAVGAISLAIMRSPIGKLLAVITVAETIGHAGDVTGAAVTRARQPGNDSVFDQSMLLVGQWLQGKVNWDFTDYPAKPGSKDGPLINPPDDAMAKGLYAPGDSDGDGDSKKTLVISFKNAPRGMRVESLPDGVAAEISGVLHQMPPSGP